MRKYTIREKQTGTFSMDVTEIMKGMFGFTVVSEAELIVKRNYNDDDERDSRMVEIVGEYQKLQNSLSNSHILDTGDNQLKIAFRAGNIVLISGKIDLESVRVMEPIIKLGGQP